MGWIEIRNSIEQSGMITSYIVGVCSTFESSRLQGEYINCKMKAVVVQDVEVCYNKAEEIENHVPGLALMAPH